MLNELVKGKLMAPTKCLIKYMQSGTERLEPHSLLICGMLKNVKLRETEYVFNGVGHEVMLISMLKLVIIRGINSGNLMYSTVDRGNTANIVLSIIPWIRG